MRQTTVLTYLTRRQGDKEMRQSTLIRYLLLPLLVVSLSPCLRFSAGETPPRWLTGAALQSSLRLPADVSWSTVPFRQALYGLAREKQVAMLLDRRVDPDRRITLAIRDQPLEEALAQVAAERGIAQTMLGPVVYFGPAAAAARLRTIAELRRQEAHRLGAAVEVRLLRLKALHWDDLATPREILAQLAQENGWRLAALERVPHDLWAAADLPPLTFMDRLCLILVQFDLTFTIDAADGSLRLEPLPDVVAIQRSYPADRRPQDAMRKWAALAPDAKMELAGSRILVTGSVEDHERIAAADRPPAERSHRTAVARPAEKRYTLRQAKGQLGDLTAKLAALLQLDLKMDRQALQQAGIALEQPVSLTVTDATVDELFEKLLGPAGCTFRHHGSVIEVLPGKKEGAGARE
jgi:hypothetical protein